MGWVDPLAVTYAEALAQEAEAQGGLDLLREVAAQAAALADAWRSSRALRAYFLSAQVGSENKRGAIDRLVAGRLHPLFGNFLRLLFRRGRLALLAGVAEALHAMVDRRMGRVPVTFQTAAPVDERTIGRWTERLRTALGKEPVVRHVVRPELVAGAVIHAGDLLVDGSARSRLAELRRRFVEAGRRRHAVPS